MKQGWAVRLKKVIADGNAGIGYHSGKPKHQETEELPDLGKPKNDKVKRTDASTDKS